MTNFGDPGMTAARRGVLFGAGALGAGALLAACGGTKTETPTATTAASPADTSVPGSGTQVKVADVPVGGGLIIKDAEVVVTQPKAGVFHAFSALCTHKQCTVGTVTDSEIDCPCHGSRFSATDGSVVKGPAREPLPAKAVSVTGDLLTVS